MIYRAGEEEVVYGDSGYLGAEKREEAIVKMAPEKVVYVSCDSSTLARDVKYFGENGYAVKRVRTVDMFGMSGHVETVALLTKKCLHCSWLGDGNESGSFQRIYKRIRAE